MQRTLLAALVGGIVMFAWGALAHMVLPIGEMGISAMPAENEVVAALKAHAPEAGTYLIPSLQGIPQDQWPASGPAAFLVWRPETSYGMGSNLGLQFAASVLAALLAAIVICHCAAGASILRKGLMTMGMGLFGWLSISASYSIWYGFSNGHSVGQGIEQAAGWFLAGLAMAAVTRKKSGS